MHMVLEQVGAADIRAAKESPVAGPARRGELVAFAYGQKIMPAAHLLRPIEGLVDLWRIPPGPESRFLADAVAVDGQEVPFVRRELQRVSLVGRA